MPVLVPVLDRDRTDGSRCGGTSRGNYIEDENMNFANVLAETLKTQNSLHFLSTGPKTGDIRRVGEFK